MAVPPSCTRCGLSAALSMMESDPKLAPAAVGVKVKVSAQAPGPGTLGTQLFVAAKSPVAENPEILSGPSPTFSSVITSGCVLVVPTSCGMGKFTIGVGRVTTGSFKPDILAMKASPGVARAVWNAPGVVGKSEERACP